MASTTPTLPAAVAKTGITTQHKRLTTGAAATLDALVSGGLPKMTDSRGNSVRPTVVTLQVESGGGVVYYTVDGSTPSATNGLVIPIAPGQIQLPYPTHLQNTGAVSASNQQIQLFSAAPQSVQALFEWWV